MSSDARAASSPSPAPPPPPPPPPPPTPETWRRVIGQLGRRERCRLVALHGREQADRGRVADERGVVLEALRGVPNGVGDQDQLKAASVTVAG